MTTLRLQLQRKMTSLILHLELRAFNDRRAAMFSTTRRPCTSPPPEDTEYYVQDLHPHGVEGKRPGGEGKGGGDMELARDALLRARCGSSYSGIQAAQLDAQLDELNRIINAEAQLNDIQLKVDNISLQPPDLVLSRCQSDPTHSMHSLQSRLSARETRSRSKSDTTTCFQHTESQDTFSKLSLSRVSSTSSSAPAAAFEFHQAQTHSCLGQHTDLRTCDYDS